MDFSAAVDYLYGLGNEMLAMKLGLESIRRLARALDDPQLEFPAVHIAGTNGKGSTAAIVAAIAESAGLRAGLYTSPHLVDITERIRIGSQQISRDDFARLATRVRSAGEELVARGDLIAPPTFFEQVTAIGYLYFAEQRVDLAVLEVGLGGRLDATNICAPVVTAITPVGSDHEQYLGETIAEIAGEKAGIIKNGVPVISAPQLAEAARVIRERAAQVEAPLVTFNEIASLVVEPGDADGLFRLRCRTREAGYEAQTGLRGRHQAINAVLAILISERLMKEGVAIDRRSVVDGLGRVRWPGRLEMIGIEGGRELLVDGAHNPDGARKLRGFLDEHYAHVPLAMIFGAMSDKALDEMARILFPAAEVIVAAPISNPRAIAPERIAQLAERFGRRAVIAASVREAIEIAARETDRRGMICACGSLYLVGEIKRECQ